MLDTEGYGRTNGICNNYFFSTATMLKLTLLNIIILPILLSSDPILKELQSIAGDGIGYKHLAFIIVGGFNVQLNIRYSETDWTLLSVVELFQDPGLGCTVPYSAVYCCHLLSLFMTYKLSSYIKNKQMTREQ